jgi:SAM-dependent methyltransferase
MKSYLYNQFKKTSDIKYFQNQITKPKYSTIKFFNFLKKNKCLNASILDCACGNGANLIYLKKKYNYSKHLLGIDFNKILVKQSKPYLKNLKNLKIEKGNILNINKKYKKKFEGIISLQTLSWLNDYEKAVTEMVKLKPKFIATTSLFWEGLIDFNIKLNYLKNESFKRPSSGYIYYNIYSLKNYVNFLKKQGFKKNIIMKFNIPKQIKQKDKTKMGTYTIKNSKGLIQMSGPLKMNWYFILSKKN